MTRLRRLFLAAFSASAVAGAALAAPAPGPPPPVVKLYRGATLIDGTGAQPKPGMSILVRGDRIEAVGPAATLQVPAGAEVVEMAGRYVTPGLINVHHHMNTPPKASYTIALMRRELYSGVTATRDPADDIRLLTDIARGALMAEFPSPDIYTAVMFAGPSFYADRRTWASSAPHTPGNVPWMQAITDKTDLREAVAMARGTSATGIKIYANLPGRLIGPITKEAHRQGLKVWTHGMVFPATPEDIVKAGADSMSHICYMAYQAISPRPQTYESKYEYPLPRALFADGKNPAMQKLFDGMAKKGIILDQTLWVFRPRPGPNAAATGGLAPQATPNNQRCDYAMATLLTRQAFLAGVPISTGTDGFNRWDEPYTSGHWEMEALEKDVGMPPLEVIKAATLNGARTIGTERDMGTIEPGKLANLVFVEKDPAASVANMKTVVLTVKRGRDYWRKDYVPLNEEESKAPPMPMFYSDMHEDE